MGDSTLVMAVEDQFLVFPLARYRVGSTCPVSWGESFAEFIGANVLPRYPLTPVIDLRGLDAFYTDVNDFITNLTFAVYTDDVYAMVDSGDAEEWKRVLGPLNIPILRATGPPTEGAEVDASYYVSGKGYPNLEHFPEVDFPGVDGFRWDTLAERDEVGDQVVGTAVIERLKQLHRHSTLIEFVMQANGDRLSLVPYHGQATHDVELPSGGVLLGRPGVIASRTAAVFTSEVQELERLINDRSTKERHIQKFLEEHPSFLRGLNYQHIYPQLVLEREGEGALKPDFVLEPYDDGFCDILDLKLPSSRVLVGRKDRTSLAAGLHEVAAQLREYAAYFEDKKHRDYVKQKYGLRVYRPRLVAIVGRDIRDICSPSARRAMTAYSDLRFMTFDELIRHSKQRMLV
jgi:hypothetical protein